MHGFGTVVVPGGAEAYHEHWEPRVFALWAVSAAERLGAGSGRILREQMPPEEYLRTSYYERWQWSNERRLLAKGTIAQGEVDDWVSRLGSGEARPRWVDDDQPARVLGVVRTATEELSPAAAGRFSSGDAVRVRRTHPPGHTRCPRYVRGASGVVKAVRGTYPFPDEGPRRGEAEHVYAVAFHSTDVFGSTEEPSWTLALDLYESYLEPA